MTKKQLTEIGDIFLTLFSYVKTKGELSAMFRELGFKKVSSTGDAYLHKEKGYVVKFPLICQVDVPKWAIKTYEIPLPARAIFPRAAEYLLVQPLADVSRKAKREFEKRAEKVNWCENICGDDCHIGNYGMYKGKPVVYDW